MFSRKSLPVNADFICWPYLRRLTCYGLVDGLVRIGRVRLVGLALKIVWLMQRVVGGRISAVFDATEPEMVYFASGRSVWWV